MFRQISLCGENEISPEGALRKYMKKIEECIENNLKKNAGDYLKA